MLIKNSYHINKRYKTSVQCRVRQRMIGQRGHVAVEQRGSREYRVGLIAGREG
jgi:hypothetical protein